MQYTYHKTFLDKLHEEEECSCCIDKTSSHQCNREKTVLWRRKTDHLSNIIFLLLSKRKYDMFIYVYHIPPAHWSVWSMSKGDVWTLSFRMSFASSTSSWERTPSFSFSATTLISGPTLLTCFAWKLEHVPSKNWSQGFQISTK